MATRNAAGLTAYVVVGIGLVVTAWYVTFAHGLREFLAGCLLGCVGLGMTMGGLAGTVYAFDQRAVLAGRIPATAIPESSPLAEAGMTSLKVGLILTAIVAALCAVGAVLVLPFMAGGCCR